jgi:hypothetical protein
MRNQPFIKIILLLILTTGISIIYSCHSKTRAKRNDSVQNTYAAQMPPKLPGSDRNDTIAMQQVKQLSEVKELERRNAYNRDSTQHIVEAVEKRPDSKFKYYKVVVGDKGPDKFQAIFHFYVYPKTWSVFYYDVSSDSVFTLDQWRKSGKDWIKGSR